MAFLGLHLCGAFETALEGNTFLKEPEMRICFGGGPKDAPPPSSPLKRINQMSEYFLFQHATRKLCSQPHSLQKDYGELFLLPDKFCGS